MSVESVIQDVLALRHDEKALEQKLREILDEKNSLVKRVQELEEKVKDLNSDENNHELFFQIDTEPKADDDNEVTQEPVDESTSISYDAKSSVMMTNQLDEDQPKKEKSPGPRNTCFNCGGDLMIADCPKPRDPKTIAQNRRKFASNQPASSARYHIDENQRFGHLKPGLPSEKLRKALGLKNDQLPPYIYNMRKLGYPPGWLRDAEIRQSGISLFLSNNKTIGHIDDEEGELSDARDKVRYDTSKLIAWPGFNTAPSDKFIFEEHKYYCPAMSNDQDISKMKERLASKSQTGYVKGQMQNTSTEKEVENIENNMEVSSSENDNTSADKTPGPASSTIKSVADGTPIVSSYSPYDSLPCQSKWAKDTTDHILFDNLPDSTGKWDQMLEVIKKGRELRELNEKQFDKDTAI